MISPEQFEVDRYLITLVVVMFAVCVVGLIAQAIEKYFK